MARTLGLGSGSGLVFRIISYSLGLAIRNLKLELAVKILVLGLAVRIGG